MVRDHSIREKAEELLSQCRKKLAISDDDKALNDTFLSKNLPSSLYPRSVNPQNAFVVTSLASPRGDGHGEFKPENDKDSSPTPKSKPLPEEVPATPTNHSPHADRMIRTKSLGSRMSKLFGIGKSSDKKKDDKESTPKDKGKKKEKGRDSAETSVVETRSAWPLPWTIILHHVDALFVCCVVLTWTVSSP